MIDEIADSLFCYFCLSGARFGLFTDLIFLKALAQESIEKFIELDQFVANAVVPLVLNVVVSAASDVKCDLGPLVLIPFMQNKEKPVLFYAPYTLVYKRVQLIFPSLTTIFGASILDFASDDVPLVGALYADILEQFFIRITIPIRFTVSGFGQINYLTLLIEIHVGFLLYYIIVYGSSPIHGT